MMSVPRSGSVQSVSTAGVSEMTSASGQSGASNTGGDTPIMIMIMIMMMIMMMTGDWATDCRGPEHVTPEASGLISEETEFGVGDNPVSGDDVAVVLYQHCL